MRQYLKEFIDLKRTAAYDLPNENYHKSKFYISIRDFALLLFGINLSILWFNVGHLFFDNGVTVALIIWIGITAYWYYTYIPTKYKFLALFGITSLLPIYIERYELITKAEQIIANWFSIGNIGY